MKFKIGDRVGFNLSNHPFKGRIMAQDKDNPHEPYLIRSETEHDIPFRIWIIESELTLISD